MPLHCIPTHTSEDSGLGEANSMAFAFTQNHPINVPGDDQHLQHRQSPHFFTVSLCKKARRLMPVWLSLTPTVDIRFQQATSSSSVSGFRGQIYPHFKQYYSRWSQFMSPLGYAGGSTPHNYCDTDIEQF